MEVALSDALRRNLGKLIEQHPPIFVKPCLRRTSKGSAAVPRLVYLASDGLLLILTSDGKKGKRIEALLDPNVLHSVFYAPKSTQSVLSSSPSLPVAASGSGSAGPSIYASRVVLWFQQSKDLALEFKHPATAAHFVSLIEDLLANHRHSDNADSGSRLAAENGSTSRSRKASDIIVPLAARSSGDRDNQNDDPCDPFSRATNMLESFHGHGAPAPPTLSAPLGEGRHAGRGDDDVGDGRESDNSRQNERSEPLRPTGAVSLATIMAQEESAVKRAEREEERRRDEALQFHIRSVAEEYLLTLEVEQLNEDIAWMTDAKERRLRGEGTASTPLNNLLTASSSLMRSTALRPAPHRRRPTEHSLDELRVLVERICRRTQQLAAQRHERECEERYLRMLRRRQLRENPERDGTERFGEHLYVPSRKFGCGGETSAAVSSPSHRCFSSSSPSRLRDPSKYCSSSPVTSLRAVAQFEDPLGLFPPAPLRPAVLPGSNRRLTSLGRPLERRYSDDVTAML